MKLYNILCLLLISGLIAPIWAQQDANINHYWITPSVTNPAFIGLEDDSTINISTSLTDYWVMMPNAPKILNVILEIPITEKNIALGASFHREEYFLLKETRASLSFNYEIKISKLSQLSFGLGLGFLDNHINFSAVNIRDFGDQLVLDAAQNQTAFQFSLATAFRYKQFYVGLNIPYFITTHKDSKIGSLTYRNNSSDATLFDKPMGISLFAKQSLLKKKISRDTHALDLLGLMSFNPVIRNNKWYTPHEMRLSFIYRMGGLSKKGKGFSHALNLQAIKFGAGYRVAWKNNSTKNNTSHTTNLMFGFELGHFLEIAYVSGINNSIETIGTTHEIICKIRIHNKKHLHKIKANNQKISLLEEQLDSQMDSTQQLYLDIQTQIQRLDSTQTIQADRIKQLDSQINTLEKDVDFLENMKDDISTIKKTIKKMKVEIERWKEIVADKNRILESILRKTSK